MPFAAENDSMFTYYSDASLAERQNKQLTNDTFVAMELDDPQSEANRAQSNNKWQSRGRMVDSDLEYGAQQDTREDDEESRQATGDIQNRRRQRLVRQTAFGKANEERDTSEAALRSKYLSDQVSPGRLERQAYTAEAALRSKYLSDQKPRKSVSPSKYSRHRASRHDSPSRYSRSQPDQRAYSPSKQSRHSQNTDSLSKASSTHHRSADSSSQGAFEMYSPSASPHLASGKSQNDVRYDSRIASRRHLSEDDERIDARNRTQASRTSARSIQRQQISLNEKNQSRDKGYRKGREYQHDNGNQEEVHSEGDLSSTSSYQPFFSPNEERSEHQPHTVTNQQQFHPEKHYPFDQSQSQLIRQAQKSPRSQSYIHGPVSSGQDQMIRIMPVSHQSRINEYQGPTMFHNARFNGYTHPNIPKQFHERGKTTNQMVMTTMTTTTTTANHPLSQYGSESPISKHGHDSQSPLMSQYRDESPGLSTMYEDKSYVGGEKQGCQAYQCQSVITRIWTSCGMFNSDDTEPGYQRFDMFAEETAAAFSVGLSDIKEKVAFRGNENMKKPSLNLHEDIDNNAVQTRNIHERAESGTRFPFLNSAHENNITEAFEAFSEEMKNVSTKATEANAAISQVINGTFNLQNKDFESNRSQIIQENNEVEIKQENNEASPQSKSNGIYSSVAKGSNRRDMMLRLQRQRKTKSGKTNKNSETISSDTENLRQIYRSLHDTIHVKPGNLAFKDMQEESSVVIEEIKEPNEDKANSLVEGEKNNNQITSRDEEAALVSETNLELGNNPLTETVWEADSVTESLNNFDKNGIDFLEEFEEDNSQCCPSDALILAEPSDALILAELMGEIEDDGEDYVVHSIFDDFSADESEIEDCNLVTAPDSDIVTRAYSELVMKPKSLGRILEEETDSVGESMASIPLDESSMVEGHDKTQLASGQMRLRLLVIAVSLYISGILDSLLKSASNTLIRSLQPMPKASAVPNDSLSAKDAQDQYTGPIKSEWTRELQQL